MPRTSPVHYIAPSAISITPNCNDSANDLAVHISPNTKIRVYSPKAGIDLQDASYQEWSLTGRNRRLSDSTKPYTVYARLPKADDRKGDGYIIFAAKGGQAGAWTDRYRYVTENGLCTPSTGMVTDSDNWWVKIGEVSLPEDGLRTVTLDTGILGTEEYNNEWALNPDALPLRIELDCTINSKAAGPTPYVYWGQQLILRASLVEGWTGTDASRFDHWTIKRNTGSRTDTQWPASDRADLFASSGTIALSHARSGDDFNGAVDPTFTVTAWGHDADDPQSETLVELVSATIGILAETNEKYELALSSAIVGYNPMTGAYTPADGVTVRIRSTDQRGITSSLTLSQITSAGLSAGYARVDSDVWTTLMFRGDLINPAEATVPISAFAAQESLVIRLVNTVGTELIRETIAFVRDGEDSKEREWIYRRNSTQGYAGTTGSAGGVPVEGQTGGVYNCYLTDDFVPDGWTDDPTGVPLQGDVEYASWRDYDKSQQRWGAFNTPIVWVRNGVDGANGTIMQRMYKSTNSGTYSGSLPAAYQNGSNGWSTAMTGVSASSRYRWVTERRSDDGGTSWGDGWSTPQIDTYLAEDGSSISIQGSAVDVIGWGENLPNWGVDGGLYLMNNGDTDAIKKFVIVDGAAMITRWDSVSCAVGDCYVADSHLWSNIRGTAQGQDSPAWQDLGQIRGEDGEDAYAVQADPPVISVCCDANGQSIDGSVKEAALSMYKGGAAAAFSVAVAAVSHCFAWKYGNTLRVSTGTLWSDGTVTLYTWKPNPSRGENAYEVGSGTSHPITGVRSGAIQVDNAATDYLALAGRSYHDLSGGGSVQVAFSSGGNTRTLTIPVNGARQGVEGAQGRPGDAGPMLYPAGKWEAKAYTSDGVSRPYVLYEPDGSYYYLNADTAGAGDVPGTSAKWAAMPQAEVVYAKFGIMDYGKMASAVFCGDWMYSQYGRLYVYQQATEYVEVDAGNYNVAQTIGEYTAVPFAFFSPLYPQGGQPGTFAPNWAVNLLTGAMYGAKGNFVLGEDGNVELRGTIRADIFYHRVTFGAGDKAYKITVSNGDVYYEGSDGWMYEVGEHYPDPSPSSSTVIVSNEYYGNPGVDVFYLQRNAAMVCIPNPLDDVNDGRTIEIYSVGGVVVRTEGLYSSLFTWPFMHGVPGDLTMGPGYLKLTCMTGAGLDSYRQWVILEWRSSDGTIYFPNGG